MHQFSVRTCQETPFFFGELTTTKEFATENEFTTAMTSRGNI
jgi:hypothetical protein